MSQKNFEYDPVTKTVTIFQDGTYSVGPSDSEQVIIKVAVKEARNVEKDKPSGPESIEIS